MRSTSIFLLAFGLLVAVAMARPGRRQSSGHYEKPENGVSDGSNGNKWATYRLPSRVRLPHLLAGKLGHPYSTFTAKKILDGKYLIITPALIFKLKENTDIKTTAAPESSTSEPDVAETTTASIDEDTTTVAVNEESTPNSEIDETSGEIPSFF
jgi:hypothetical protein